MKTPAFSTCRTPARRAACHLTLHLAAVLFALLSTIDLAGAANKAQAQERAFDHAGLARQALERHLRPGYGKLLEAARNLEEKASAFCKAEPGRDNAPLHQAFRETVLAWSRMAHIEFGPIQEDRRQTRLFYWPDRKGIGRRQVSAALRKRDPSVIDPASLARKSVAVQGLGALEQILYGAGAQTFATASEARDHRCAYMIAVAANIEGIAADILSGWSAEGSYARIYLAPGLQNPIYLEPSEVTLEIAKAFLVGLERLRDVKIAGPLGLRKKSSRRSRAAFRSSRLSSEAIAAGLEGLMGLYTHGGLQRSISDHESGMGEAILSELEHSLSVLNSITIPMGEAAEDTETAEKLVAIGFPLKNARSEAARILAQAAGINLGFNALDGD